MGLAVNGVPRQQSSTAEMIFGVHHLVWYLSQFMVLHPGDLINTGTPAGVALGTPGEPYLRAGDVVELWISGLGTRATAVRGRPVTSGPPASSPAWSRWSPAAAPASVPPSPTSCGHGARRWPSSTSRARPTRTSVRCDVTDRAQVDAAVQAVLARHGRLDIVVNNAGIAAVGTVEDNDDAEWHRVLDVNVVGMARVSAAALPALRRSPAAAIVNVCSIAALNGLPQRALYSASKGAVLALTFAMATDHVREGIRVNAVSPGTVHTAFVDRMLQQFDDPAAERAALDARQATGRMVTPEEVAGAVAYLASPRSGSTTGTALEVDGGRDAPAGQAGVVGRHRWWPSLAPEARISSSRGFGPSERPV